MLRINDQIVADAEQNLLSREVFVGIKTGFNNLDFLTDGFANGQLIILGARPAMGKTTFACSLVNNVCVNGGKSCVFYTSEMSVNRTIEWLIRIQGDVKRNEKDSEIITEKIKSASEKVKKARLWLDDTCVGNPSEFIEICQMIGNIEKIDLIIIDYLQLFESDTGHLEDVLGSLKKLAVEQDCPVLVLSQLKRTVENRTSHFPEISDFPSSKLMKAAADELLFLYRDAYYDQSADKNDALISVARHRKHRKINTSIYFDPEIPMFRSDIEFKKANYPNYPNAEQSLQSICYKKAHEIYGKKLPDEVAFQFELEFHAIKENGFASLFMIAYEFVKKCRQDGYPVGYRGTSGASFISFLLGISETNPLPAHYRCKKCGYVDFYISGVGGFHPGDVGIDLPDAHCPECGEALTKDGYDLPVETFLGCYLNKEPNFTIDCAPGYKRKAQQALLDSCSYTPGSMEVLYGYDALQFLKYLHDETGVDPMTVPMEDEKVMSLFSGIEELGIHSEQIGGVDIGTLGVPEFGGYRARTALEFIRPKRFSDFIRISSLMHDTWECDPFELLRDNDLSISEFIGNRDDIMLYLMSKGVNRETAFRIMEAVRKGLARHHYREEWPRELLDKDVPGWYMKLFKEIRYLFPKAHSAIRTLMSWRLLYYKLYYPQAFYKGWLKYEAQVIDEDFVRRGYDFAKKEFERLTTKDSKQFEDYQLAKLDEVLVVMEMHARGICLDEK